MTDAGIRNQASSVDVAIIGGGLSGLSAALQLAESAPDLTISVYEASDRVGGRTLADEDGTDLGAGYVGPGQDHLMRLIDRFGLKLAKVPTEGKTIQSIRSVVDHYQGMIPPLPLLSQLELNAALIWIEKHQALVNTNDPSKSTGLDVEKLDRMTCEELISSLVPDGDRFTYARDARNILTLAIKSILCVSPAEVSALGVLWYIATSGGTKRVFETKDGLQDSKVEGGVGRVAVLIAEELQDPKRHPNVHIHLRSPLRHLEWTPCNDNENQQGQRDRPFASSLYFDRPRGTGKEKGNESRSQTLMAVEAKRVIMAIPPLQQSAIRFTPPLPPNRFQALQRWPMGHIIKTITYYDEPFWRENNLNGAGISDEGISLVFMDDTKSDGRLPGLMGFVLADQAFQWGTKTKEERKQALAKHYARLFQDNRALKPVNYKEKNWAEEPYVGGCYVGVPAPCALTTYHSREVMTAPLNNSIFVAGTESALKSVGYMDGAVEAGERAARDVLVSMGRLHPEKGNGQLHVPDPSPQMPRTVIPTTALELWLPTARQFVAGVAVVLSGATWFAYSLLMQS